MKTRRRKNAIRGDAKELAALAREIYTSEKKPDAGRARLRRSEQDARAALQKFVDDVQSLRVDWINMQAVAETIERVLAVDMTKPGNRKGDVPAALDLVSRIAHSEDVLHRSVYLMMDRLLHTSNEKHELPTKSECARRVARAFADADIATLREDQVDTIYDRWLEAGPAPVGPTPKGTKRAWQ